MPCPRCQGFLRVVCEMDEDVIACANCGLRVYKPLPPFPERIERRGVERMTECKRGHPMIDTNIYVYRNVNTGRDNRRCKQCMRTLAEARRRKAVA